MHIRGYQSKKNSECQKLDQRLEEKERSQTSPWNFLRDAGLTPRIQRHGCSEACAKAFRDTRRLGSPSLS